MELETNSKIEKLEKVQEESQEDFVWIFQIWLQRRNHGINERQIPGIQRSSWRQGSMNEGLIRGRERLKGSAKRERETKERVREWERERRKWEIIYDDISCEKWREEKEGEKEKQKRLDGKKKETDRVEIVKIKI